MNDCQPTIRFCGRNIPIVVRDDVPPDVLFLMVDYEELEEFYAAEE